MDPVLKGWMSKIVSLDEEGELMDTVFRILGQRRGWGLMEGLAKGEGGARGDEKIYNLYF